MGIVELYTWLCAGGPDVNNLYRILKTSDIHKIKESLENTKKPSIYEAYRSISANTNLKHLIWSVNPTNTPGTPGTYLKSVDNNRYYKLSAGSSLSGIFGHESVNECIISDILDSLGIKHVKYYGNLSDICIDDKELETFVCWSDNYREVGDSKLPLDTHYELHHLKGEEVIPYLKRMEFWNDIQNYILVDFLVINRDRHGANIEVIKHSNGTSTIAPIFDNGLSLVAPQQNCIERIELFDCMTDVTVNNFIGSKSLYDNLKLIDAPLRTNCLTEQEIANIVTRYELFLSPTHIHKIIEILWSRYQYLEKEGFICH